MSTAVRKPDARAGGVEVAGPGDAGQGRQDGHREEAADAGHVVVDRGGQAGVLVGHRDPSAVARSAGRR